PVALFCHGTCGYPVGEAVRSGRNQREKMNRFDLPDLGIGIGLRTTHYGAILEGKASVAWFEVLSENYMQTRGRPLAILDRIAERHPVAMHGVSMSIGSTDPLDRGYLAELKSLR